MSAIYYDQGSDVKAKQCKTIITFDTILESKILDAGNLLILSNLQKPWTIACKDISRVFEIEYSTYCILNRSELCMKHRHTRTIFKYCFPFLPISRIVHTSRRTDLFVEVTNVTKGNGIWVHFISTGYFPSQIQLSRLIQKDDVQIETVCCIFKQIRINWSSINVTGISGTMITMPDTAYVSIFMDNDLTRITEDHFETKFIARLLDQMHVVQPPVFLLRYDDVPPSVPQFLEHLHSLLTRS